MTSSIPATGTHFLHPRALSLAPIFPLFILPFYPCPFGSISNVRECDVTTESAPHLEFNQRSSVKIRINHKGNHIFAYNCYIGSKSHIYQSMEKNFVWHIVSYVFFSVKKD